MASELETYLAAVRNAPLPAQPESEQQRQARAAFPGRFLAAADSVLKPVFDSAAATLHLHGFGATVELVRELAGADPNSFPYIILHFSANPCPPSDLGYIYTLAGASVSFICRRNQVSWRLAYWRVRIFTNSMVSAKDRSPRRCSTTWR